MKKSIALILSMFLILSLFIGTTSFAEADAEEDPYEEATTALEETTEESTTVKLSKAEILAMSNYMNGTGVASSGKWTARWAYDNGKLRMRIINRTSGQSTIAGANAQPYYMIADGYNIIYLSATQLRGQAEIRRVRVSGGCDEKLIDVAKTGVQGRIDHLFQYKDHLYFTVNNENTAPITGTFFRADMDGENICPVLEKAIYYPYIINDKLYYQDDGDQCRLHVCNMDGTADQLVIDDVVFAYFTDGISFYYQSFDKKAEFDDNNKILNVADLKYCFKKYTPGEETKVFTELYSDRFAFDGRTVYYTDADDDGRLYTCDTVTGSIDVLCINDYIANIVFYDPSTFICVDGSKSGLEDVFFMNLNGSGLSKAE